MTHTNLFKLIANKYKDNKKCTVKKDYYLVPERDGHIRVDLKVDNSYNYLSAAHYTLNFEFKGKDLIFHAYFSQKSNIKAFHIKDKTCGNKNITKEFDEKSVLALKNIAIEAYNKIIKDELEKLDQCEKDTWALFADFDNHKKIILEKINYIIKFRPRRKNFYMTLLDIYGKFQEKKETTETSTYSETKHEERPEYVETVIEEDLNDKKTHVKESKNAIKEVIDRVQKLLKSKEQDKWSKIVSLVDLLKIIDNENELIPKFKKKINNEFDTHNLETIKSMFASCEPTISKDSYKKLLKKIEKCADDKTLEIVKFLIKNTSGFDEKDMQEIIKTCTLNKNYKSLEHIVPFCKSLNFDCILPGSIRAINFFHWTIYNLVDQRLPDYDLMKYIKLFIDNGADPNQISVKEKHTMQKTKQGEALARKHLKSAPNIKLLLLTDDINFNVLLRLREKPKSLQLIAPNLDSFCDLFMLLGTIYFEFHESIYYKEYYFSRVIDVFSEKKLIKQDNIPLINRCVIFRVNDDDHKRCLEALVDRIYQMVEKDLYDEDKILISIDNKEISFFKEDSNKPQRIKIFAKLYLNLILYQLSKINEMKFKFNCQKLYTEAVKIYSHDHVRVLQIIQAEKAEITTRIELLSQPESIMKLINPKKKFHILISHYKKMPIEDNLEISFLLYPNHYAIVVVTDKYLLAIQYTYNTCLNKLKKVIEEFDPHRKGKNYIIGKYMQMNQNEPWQEKEIYQEVVKLFNAPRLDKPDFSISTPICKATLSKSKGTISAKLDYITNLDERCDEISIYHAMSNIYEHNLYFPESGIPLMDQDLITSKKAEISSLVTNLDCAGVVSFLQENFINISDAINSVLEKTYNTAIKLQKLDSLLEKTYNAEIKLQKPDSSTFKETKFLKAVANKKEIILNNLSKLKNIYQCLMFHQGKFSKIKPWSSNNAEIDREYKEIQEISQYSDKEFAAYLKESHKEVDIEEGGAKYMLAVAVRQKHKDLFNRHETVRAATNELKARKITPKYNSVEIEYEDGTVQKFISPMAGAINKFLESRTSLELKP